MTAKKRSDAVEIKSYSYGENYSRNRTEIPFPDANYSYRHVLKRNVSSLQTRGWQVDPDERNASNLADHILMRIKKEIQEDYMRYVQEKDRAQRRANDVAPDGLTRKDTKPIGR